MILDLLLWHHWWWNVLRNLSGINLYWKLSLLDPLQFAYQTRRGVEDAPSTLLNMIMKHLDGRKTNVKLLFVDFSSAFNTIIYTPLLFILLLIPHVLVKKLISEFKLEFKIVGWCDEWGGAESHGNGARPVEWMIMNDTCATHRSRVPRRSSGRNKRRSDDIGRRERTRPGF